MILLRDIHVALTPDGAREHDLAAIEICKKRYRRTLKNAFGDADFYVYKKSIDARDRNKIEYIYTVAAQPHESISEDKLQTLRFPLFGHIRRIFRRFPTLSAKKNVRSWSVSDRPECSVPMRWQRPEENRSF